MLGAAQQMRATADGSQAAARGRRSSLENARLAAAGRPAAKRAVSFGTCIAHDCFILPIVCTAKTIGKALFARLAKSAKLVLDGIHDERIHKAVLWGSEYRFWSNNYETKLPSFFSHRSIQRHPFFAAAKLNAFLKERYPWGIQKHRELGPLLREAASSQRDAYYRHWFVELADRLDDVLAKESQRYSGFPFRNLFGDRRRGRRRPGIRPGLQLSQLPGGQEGSGASFVSSMLSCLEQQEFQRWILPRPAIPFRFSACLGTPSKPKSAPGTWNW